MQILRMIKSYSRTDHAHHDAPVTQMVGFMPIPELLDQTEGATPSPSDTHPTTQFRPTDNYETSSSDNPNKLDEAKRPPTHLPTQESSLVPFTYNLSDQELDAGTIIGSLSDIDSGDDPIPLPTSFSDYTTHTLQS